MTFSATIKAGYPESAGLFLGAATYGGVVDQTLPIHIPLKTLNRHGLVAGATGTGKTKALQHVAEELSKNGMPVLIMDMKGDVSGLAQPGTSDERILARAKAVGIDWQAETPPVEFVSISDEPGVRMRATVSEFGPLLLAKMLELNETQESVLTLLFKFADDHTLPLCDIKDMRKMLVFLSNEGKMLLKEGYGGISTATIGIILRKILELESQGADTFFAEPSFDVHDLVRVDERGRGYVHVLRLGDIQNKPQLFSTFMLSLIAEIYQQFPEVGDLPKPKLVIMIDEAHLVFKFATKTLLSELETVVKLIRSKGVGLIFCTQLPTDIPPVILSQLGLKIQFALRAFTAMDRKAIKLIAQNYPETQHYDVDTLLTQLGIGEALVTALDAKGIPTPLVHTMLAPPTSRMAPITTDELQATIAESQLVEKYEQTVDRESAYEILAKKLEAAGAPSTVAQTDLDGRLRELFGGLQKTITRTVIQNVTSQITRTILGSLMRR